MKLTRGDGGNSKEEQQTTTDICEADVCGKMIKDEVRKIWRREGDSNPR
jgi:hypothetical protein